MMAIIRMTCISGTRGWVVEGVAGPIVNWGVLRGVVVVDSVTS